MLRTNGHIALSVFFCLIFTNPSFAQNQSDKTQAIDSQSNTPESSQSNAEVSQDAYGLQTTDVEKQFPNLDTNDVEKQFPNLETTDVEKQFSGIDTKDVEKQFPNLDTKDVEKQFSNT